MLKHDVVCVRCLTCGNLIKVCLLACLAKEPQNLEQCVSVTYRSVTAGSSGTLVLHLKYKFAFNRRCPHRFVMG